MSSGLSAFKAGGVNTKIPAWIKTLPHQFYCGTNSFAEYISDYGDTNASSLSKTIKFKNITFLCGGGAAFEWAQLKKNASWLLQEHWKLYIARRNL